MKSDFQNKRKIQYFWNAYKIPVIVVSALFILLGIMAVPAFFPKSETVWNSYYINSSLSSKETKKIMKDFQKKQIQDSNDQHDYFLDTSMSFSFKKTAPNDYDQLGKFTALIAGKEIDFVLSDPEVIRHYAELAGFADLDQLLTAQESAKWRDRLIYFYDKNGNKKAYAVDLTDKKIANGKTVYGAIPLSSERKKMSLKFLDYIWSEK